MTNLYEYQYEKLPDGLKEDKLKEFKKFLDEVWQKYKDNKPPYWRENLYDNEPDEDTKTKQPFLFFVNGKVKSKNYIGYIKFKDYEFNLYPKICAGESNTEKINNMLLLWMQYSSNVVLPELDSSLAQQKNCDFIEILIYLFAKYTSELLSISIYQHYEEISEETSFLKGKLNFNEYIKNCACGKSHKFNCTYDSFEINNKFNQIIKYVSKCLYEITHDNNNRNYLIDIMHCLDEVDDIICSYSDCESVYINRFMSDFNTVLDYCKLFLSNSVTFNEWGEFDTFAFLLRTDALFEDFISNFSKKKFPELNIQAQKQDKLDESGKFHYRPDLIVGNGESKKVIDIKYKDISSHSNISYADIYQCITYAIKETTNDVTLLYPVFGEKKVLDSIKIKKTELLNSDININFRFINCCAGNSIEEIEANIVSEMKSILEEESPVSKSDTAG